MARVAFAVWWLSAAALTVSAAPPASPAAPAKPLPVAVVNMAKVLGECAPGKALLEPWKAYIAKKQGEFRVKMTEKQKIDAALENKDKPVKADEKAAMEKRASALEKEMEAIQGEAEVEGEKIESGREQIRVEAERLLKEIAKERGAAVYFDISPAPPPPQIPGLPPQPAPKLPIVLDPDADLTDALIKRLADFKVKAPTATKDPPVLPGKDNPCVALETSMGEIVVELDPVRSPITVANFLKYVDAKHYDNTIFHRVIKGFMIQGGGLDAKMTEKKTEAPIKNEADNRVSNLRGTIAMARTADPDSATAQFFINHADNRKLDYKNPENFGYAVFGNVIKGMEVVDKIAAVETGDAPNGMKNVPVKAVFILSAKRVAKPETSEKKEEPRKDEPKKEEPKK